MQGDGSGSHWAGGKGSEQAEVVQDMTVTRHFSELIKECIDPLVLRNLVKHPTVTIRRNKESMVGSSSWL